MAASVGGALFYHCSWNQAVSTDSESFDVSVLRTKSPLGLDHLNPVMISEVNTPGRNHVCFNSSARKGRSKGAVRVSLVKVPNSETS